MSRENFFQPSRLVPSKDSIDNVASNVSHTFLAQRLFDQRVVVGGGDFAVLFEGDLELGDPLRESARPRLACALIQVMRDPAPGSP